MTDTTHAASGIHIVAGFLGAGKTTFINKLFANGIDPRSTVLIENEFGETSIDDELVQVGDLEMRTLTSGCICCSLRGDLASTIEMVVSELAPKTILIEPTGVASPNELIRLCANDLWNLPLEVESVITIVNAQTVEEMLDLEIGVFEAQLQQARLILLSRTQFMDADQISHARTLLWDYIGWHVPILDAPWDDLDALEVLGIAQEACARDGSPLASGAGGSAGAGRHDGHGHNHEHACGCEHEHGHEHEHEHEHEHACGCEHEDGHGHTDHVHSAGEIESIVVYPEGSFDQNALQSLSSRFESGQMGQVLRAKGFLKNADGTMLHVEYVYGSMQVSATAYASEPKLVIIGRNLAKWDGQLAISE